MKRIIAALICIFMSVGCLASCTMNKPENTAKTDSSKKIKIVATIFPEYDWVKQILGEKSENAEITLLLDNGVDLHSYQPTADDLLKIAGCDLFIYVGGESDEWVEDALANRRNPDTVIINLLNELGDIIKTEEIKEGMQAEDEEDEPGKDEETEYDEHVWLSLKNTCTLCGVISEKICEVDPENAEIYKANTAAYTEKLKSLDAMYKNAVNSSNVKTLIFGDRFPFRYLTDDYDLDYYAAFAGCSAESEADFETIVFLAKKLDELNLGSIMQTESSDGSIAQAIKDASKAGNQQILTLDSLQSTTSADIENGVTYLSVMEKNLEVLKEAMK